MLLKSSNAKTDNMGQKLPETLKVQDLSPLYEAFLEEDDEHGNPIFVYSSFGYITEEFEAYFGQSNLRKYDLRPENIRDSLELLPDDDVYPKAHSCLTTFETTSLRGDLHYRKGPNLNNAFKGTGLLPQLTLQEAEVLELLSQNPHPYIVPYHGCCVARGRIVGLVFDRYPMTLQQRLEEDGRAFDGDAWADQITSAVRHLHSLGLAHNDLNPMNIMIDGADTPHVIDFGSCRPFGEDLITAGSVGWIEEEFTVSKQKHDEFALKQIRSWLKSRQAKI